LPGLCSRLGRRWPGAYCPGSAAAGQSLLAHGAEISLTRKKTRASGCRAGDQKPRASDSRAGGTGKETGQAFSTTGPAIGRPSPQQPAVPTVTLEGPLPRHGVAAIILYVKQASPKCINIRIRENVLGCVCLSVCLSQPSGCLQTATRLRQIDRPTDTPQLIFRDSNVYVFGKCLFDITNNEMLNTKVAQILVS
jgi:hypothetical protein